MGEPGGLPSMGSHRVGHDWSDIAAAAAAAAAVVKSRVLENVHWSMEKEEENVDGVGASRKMVELVD